MQDVLHHADTAQPAMGRHAGKPVILPSSFTSSPRYLHSKFMDGMAIVRCLGGSSLFITMTCNPRYLHDTCIYTAISKTSWQYLHHMSHKP
jgi:hypothetical protein